MARTETRTDTAPRVGVPARLLLIVLMLGLGSYGWWGINQLLAAVAGQAAERTLQLRIVECLAGILLEVECAGFVHRHHNVSGAGRG